MPNISRAELKVLVAVLYNYMQVGGEEPTSLGDIEHITGLSRTTVIATQESLLASQILERQVEERSFIYIPDEILSLRISDEYGARPGLASAGDQRE